MGGGGGGVSSARTGGRLGGEGRQHQDSGEMHLPPVPGLLTPHNVSPPSPSTAYLPDTSLPCPSATYPPQCVFPWSCHCLLPSPPHILHPSPGVAYPWCWCWCSLCSFIFPRSWHCSAPSSPKHRQGLGANWNMHCMGSSRAEGKWKLSVPVLVLWGQKSPKSLQLKRQGDTSGH